MIKLVHTELSDGGVHIVLIISVDGKMIRFVLDTGASHSVLDVEWARENLSNDEINQVDDAAQGISTSVEVHKAQISSLQIGDLSLSNHPIALIDFTAINTVYQKEGLEEIHGILGGDILFDYQAIINYAKMELYFQIT